VNVVAGGRMLIKVALLILKFVERRDIKKDAREKKADKRATTLYLSNSFSIYTISPPSSKPYFIYVS
jgi:hypothetical protein